MGIAATPSAMATLPNAMKLPKFSKVYKSDEQHLRRLFRRIGCYLIGYQMT
uniref:Uncharacterized protein n=1 Tax=Tetraselmis sp. GSL018 TaxID=582737 RepID=A0A061S4T6_9CHLO